VKGRRGGNLSVLSATCRRKKTDKCQPPNDGLLPEGVNPSVGLGDRHVSHSADELPECRTHRKRVGCLSVARAPPRRSSMASAASAKIHARSRCVRFDTCGLGCYSFECWTRPSRGARLISGPGGSLALSAFIPSPAAPADLTDGNSREALRAPLGAVPARPATPEPAAPETLSAGPLAPFLTPRCTAFQRGTTHDGARARRDVLVPSCVAPWFPQFTFGDYCPPAAPVSSHPRAGSVSSTDPCVALGLAAAARGALRTRPGESSVPPCVLLAGSRGQRPFPIFSRVVREIPAAPHER
jgi:hypothetical protein